MMCHNLNPNLNPEQSKMLPISGVYVSILLKVDTPPTQNKMFHIWGIYVSILLSVDFFFKPR